MPNIDKDCHENEKNTLDKNRLKASKYVRIEAPYYDDKDFIRLPRQRTDLSAKTPWLKYSLNSLSSDLHLICTFIVTVKIGSDMAFLIG